MGSVNKAILVGNLGRDAEMRFTAGGTPVATVSIATTERFTDRDGQKREDTQWHRIVIWGKTAESLHEYLTKGKQIYVEGRIQTRDWTDKEGKQQRTTEIRADRIVLLGAAAAVAAARPGPRGRVSASTQSSRSKRLRAASTRRTMTTYPSEGPCAVTTKYGADVRGVGASEPAPQVRFKARSDMKNMKVMKSHEENLRGFSS